MDILELMLTRYTTKHFDPTRRVSDKDMDTLLEVLRLSPSSTNIQPWKFYVIDTPEIKEKMMPAVKDFNIERMKAPQFIIFTVPKHFTKEYFDELYAQEKADGRFKEWTSPERPDAIRQTYAGKFDNDPEGLLVDSTILGGLDFEMLDEIFGFKQKDEQSVVAIAPGYRAENDSNARRPKSRLPRERVIEFLR